jgi:hypothetical protein
MQVTTAIFGLGAPPPHFGSYVFAYKFVCFQRLVDYTHDFLHLGRPRVMGNNADGVQPSERGKRQLKATKWVGAPRAALLLMVQGANSKSVDRFPATKGQFDAALVTTFELVGNQAWRPVPLLAQSGRTRRVVGQEVLAGLVERVTFHNTENGFCVLRAKIRGHRDLVTVVGHAATISAGERITASGEWINDAPTASSSKRGF